MKWVWSLLLLGCTVRAEDAGFTSIFDGKTLAGWSGQDNSFWSVEDEAITGTISTNHVPGLNQYLVWQGGLVGDFELKLEFRLAGEAAKRANGGFQFRSRRLPNGDVGGYQIDNNRDTPWKVRIYDEFGRHNLAMPGERTTFDAEGHRTVEKITLDAAATNFAVESWHEYHLIADGPKLSLFINGHLFAETFDRDPDSFEASGILALQLHTGPPQKAQFRNISLKKIRPAPAPGSREELLARAAFHWQPGERIDAHQPKMKPVGKIRPGLVDSGSGFRYAHFDEASFDLQVEYNQPKAWNMPGETMTVWLRARAPEGDWTHALVAKRGGHDTCNFNLFSVDLPETPGPDIGFEVHTDRGFFMVSFPVSRIDAKTWHDLTGIYDGTAIRVLCDGHEMAKTPARGRLTANQEPLLIGAETNHGQVVRPFTGDMADVGLWTRALTEQEIATLLSP